MVRGLLRGFGGRRTVLERSWFGFGFGFGGTARNRFGARIDGIGRIFGWRGFGGIGISFCGVGFRRLIGGWGRFGFGTDERFGTVCRLIGSIMLGTVWRLFLGLFLGFTDTEAGFFTWSFGFGIGFGGLFLWLRFGGGRVFRAFLAEGEARA